MKQPCGDAIGTNPQEQKLLPVFMGLSWHSATLSAKRALENNQHSRIESANAHLDARGAMVISGAHTLLALDPIDCQFINPQHPRLKEHTS
ncbi:MAG: hypothetical protein JNG84_07310 [Archangium sp.]|nr:hypothetical protein [Archangium sp.]